MLSFFKKRNYIADYLEGLTDMHCHVLPGIDDGAEDEAMSLTMLNQYVELGYSGLVATPHIMDGLYQNTSTKITEHLKLFKKMMAENGYENFEVSAASEYMLDQGFNKLLENIDFLSISSNKVLVEMSFFQRNIYVETQIFNLQQKGFEPILAHPERYAYLARPEDILEFQKKGCYLQLNLLSLSGHYGPEVYKQAIALLKDNQYDFLGTDAHRPAHLHKLKEITIPSKLTSNFEALIARTKENMV